MLQTLRNKKDFWAKILIVAGFLLVVSSVATPHFGHAANSILSGQICEPDNANSSTNLGRCINNIYIVAISIAGIVALLMFIIAGYMYSTGTTESVSKAKSIMGSTVAALVILFGAYVLLNTIDPEFTKIPKITPPKIDCTGDKCLVPETPTTPGTGGTGGTGAGGTGGTGAKKGVSEATQLAAGVLVSSPLVSYTAGTDCPPNGSKQVLKAIAAGDQAQYDGPGSSCAAGTTDLSLSMLNGLIKLTTNNFRFTITALTNGHHANSTDPHYQGRAADIVPGDRSKQGEIINTLYGTGAQQVAVECTSGPAVFIVMGLNQSGTTGSIAADPSRQSAADSCSASSGRGYHLHIVWGG